MTSEQIDPKAPDSTVHYDYDQDVDILYISFGSDLPATTAVELNENILLRLNLATRTVVGITLMDFSVLAQPTPMGPRHFPLNGLQELDPDWQEWILDLLVKPPVSHVLIVAAYSASARETIPIVAVENLLAVAG